MYFKLPVYVFVYTHEYSTHRDQKSVSNPLEFLLVMSLSEKEACVLTASQLQLLGACLKNWVQYNASRHQQWVMCVRVIDVKNGCFKSFKNLLNSLMSVSFVLWGQNTWYWLLYWEVYLRPGLRRLRSLRGWGHVLLGSGEGFLLFQNGRPKGGPAHGDETQEWPRVTNWLSCSLTQACENLSIPTLDTATWQGTFNLNWNRVQTPGVVPLLRASAELMFPRNRKRVST